MHKFVPVIALAALTALVPCAAQAAPATGTDNAGNYKSGDYPGNKGTGFGAFTGSAVNGANGTAAFSGTFLETSTKSEDGSANIDSSNGTSFGMYANGGASASITVSRPFAMPLQNTGDTFSLRLVNGYLQTGATFGVNLNTASGPVGTFSFKGGANNYLFNGADTGKVFDTGVITLTYTVTAPNTYSLTATATGSSPFTYTATGTATGPFTGFSVFEANNSSGSSHNAYFNTLSVTNVQRPGASAAAARPAPPIQGAR